MSSETQALSIVLGVHFAPGTAELLARVDALERALQRARLQNLVLALQAARAQTEAAELREETANAYEDMGSSIMTLVRHLRAGTMPDEMFLADMEEAHGIYG
jgi:hypothetical protein